LLDILTYRQSGHSPSDAGAYRTREEIALWREVDPLREFRSQILDARAASEGELQQLSDYAVAKMLKACKLAIDLEISPRLTSSAIARVMFSHQSERDLPGIRQGDILKPLEENSRVQAIRKKSRSGIDPQAGAKLGENKAVSFRDALFEAIIHHFYH